MKLGKSEGEGRSTHGELKGVQLTTTLIIFGHFPIFHG